MDGASYYARRSARDPEWRDAQIADARERERRRFEEDPEAFRAAARERHAATGSGSERRTRSLGDDRRRQRAAGTERRAKLSTARVARYFRVAKTSCTPPFVPLSYHWEATSFLRNTLTVLGNGYVGLPSETTCYLATCFKVGAGKF